MLNEHYSGAICQRTLWLRAFIDEMIIQIVIYPKNLATLFLFRDHQKNVVHCLLGSPHTYALTLKISIFMQNKTDTIAFLFSQNMYKWELCISRKKTC